MTWEAIVIIGLVLAMMLGPVLLLKPNKRQDQLAKMRSEALSLGMKVSMGKLQEPVAVYTMSWPASPNTYYGDAEWLLQRKNYQHPIHLNGVWDWHDSQAKDAVVKKLVDSLDSLPDSVQAITATRNGLGLYWQEKGGQPQLQNLAEWLDRMRTSLWPEVERSRQGS